MHLKDKSHIFPVTNASFNKTGSLLVIGSHDRTAKVIDTQTGSIKFKLSEHKNVVFTAVFNTPFNDKIITGSFDKTMRVWDAENGNLLRTYICPSEVLSLGINQKNANLVACGCYAGECIVWDIIENREVASLLVCSLVSS